MHDDEWQDDYSRWFNPDILAHPDSPAGGGPASSRAVTVDIHLWPTLPHPDSPAGKNACFPATDNFYFVSSRFYVLGGAKPITATGIADAAATLGVEVAVIQAVTSVEARGHGFLNDGEPKILFERHKFSKFTARRFDRDYPKISNRKAGGYAGGIKEYDRISLAASLDLDAALRATSWGMFQILGDNFSACGYSDVRTFVDDMAVSEDLQLSAFVKYVQSCKLTKYLKAHDWAHFAAHYNGPDYAENDYDTKLADAYAAALPQKQ